MLSDRYGRHQLGRAEFAAGLCSSSGLNWDIGSVVAAAAASSSYEKEKMKFVPLMGDAKGVISHNQKLKHEDINCQILM